MITDKTYIRLNKLITEEQLSVNDLNIIISYLQRRYIDLIVKSNIEAMLNMAGTAKETSSPAPDAQVKVLTNC